MCMLADLAQSSGTSPSMSYWTQSNIHSPYIISCKDGSYISVAAIDHGDEDTIGSIHVLNLFMKDGTSMTLPECKYDPKAISDSLQTEFESRINSHKMTFNAYTFSRYCPYLLFPSHIYYDELSDMCYTDIAGEPKAIDDTGIMTLRIFSQSKYTDMLAGSSGKIDWSDSDFRGGVLCAARLDSRNSFRDHVESTTWDGTPRIATMFQDFLGATDNPEYLTIVAKAWLLGAITRQYQAARHEIIPAFIGEQGLGKTSFLMMLGGQYYGSTKTSMDDDKTFRESIKGRVIVELGEGKSITKDIAATKEFLSRATDCFRDSYATFAREHERKFIVAITSDNREFINDQAGARRFYPIHCTEHRKFDTRVDITDEMKNYVDQIWAEALDLYKHGEKAVIPYETYMKFIDIQNSIIEYNDIISRIDEYLDSNMPKLHTRTTIASLIENVFGILDLATAPITVQRQLSCWIKTNRNWVLYKNVKRPQYVEGKTRRTYLERVKEPEYSLSEPADISPNF